MKNIFRVNVFTYLILLLSLLSGYGKSILIIYFILFVHELGHFFLMKLYNIRVKSITFYPYGGMIKSNMLINTNSRIVLLVSLGGIIIQLVLFGFCFIFYKFNIINYELYSLFNKCNSYIIFFNMLPIYPLDGFKVLCSLLEMFFSFKYSLRVSVIINFIVLVLFLVYLYYFNINNYIIVIFLLSNLVNYIKSIKYIVNKFYLERMLYDIKYDGLISVSSKDNMFKNKYNYINGIGEEYVLKS